MKKFLKWLLLGALALVIIGVSILFLVWKAAAPEYTGTLQIKQLQDTVAVFTDDHGIPHISAKNKKDLYYTLGFLSAQERMLQIELMRRVSKGQLSEAFGEQALPVDKLFLTLGTDELAKRNAAEFLDRNPEGIEEVHAFVAGVNEVILNQTLPFELKLAGLQPDTFTVEDIFAIAAYMAYGFALAPKTDPLATQLADAMGEDWVNDLWLNADSIDYSSPIQISPTADTSYSDVLELLPVPIFHGSNSWAVNASRTSSGKAILCNDTHIGYGIPQVWYEAHLSCPGFEFYGNFLPGIPYALVGHNRAMGWGLTMFENDDLDFYVETYSPDSSGFMFESEPYPSVEITKPISVKDQSPVLLNVVRSKHGPIINEIMSEVDSEAPVSIRWDYAQGENRLLEAFRQMNNASDIDKFSEALPLIHGPGLNVVYADTANHIAWWACARMLEWNDHVNTKYMLRGDRAEDAPLGSQSFELNPHLIDPDNGIVVSANEQHSSFNNKIYPGYYVPPSRAKRIQKLLAQRSDWNTDGMKSLLMDNICEEDSQNAQLLHDLIQISEGELGEIDREALTYLNWNGSYAVNSQGALIFQRLNYQLLKHAFEDEMTQAQFEQFMHLHWMKRAAQKLLASEDHPAWDNTLTDEKEQRSTWLVKAFQLSVKDLQSIYGSEPQEWTWGRAHQLTIKHPLATNSLTASLLNLGPLEAPGGNETINQSGFIPREHPTFVPHFGPQMRIIIDFKNVELSESITPCGQSGHRWSPFYMDQFEAYVNGDFRGQLMNWKSIHRTQERNLVPLD